MTQMIETEAERLEAESHHRPPRAELVQELIVRDGLVCQFPGCGAQLDVDGIGPLEITIDHWIPQAWAYANGWTYEQVWDISNLKLMEKKCNAKKGDLLPNEDGTIPARKVRTFRYRRDKRAQRAEVCVACNAGRNLGPNEVCAACNSGPQPERFPRWAKVSSVECDHELFWCWACSIGIVDRVNTVGIAMRQADSDEIGELFDEE